MDSREMPAQPLLKQEYRKEGCYLPGQIVSLPTSFINTVFPNFNGDTPSCNFKLLTVTVVAAT